MPVNLQSAQVFGYNDRMAKPSWEELKSTVVATIEEDGTETVAEVHPGAILVAWQHYSEKQLALPGVKPGRMWSTIAVVSSSDPPDPVDAEDAIDAAIEYAADELPMLRGQPTLVDVPGDDSKIRDALESAAQEMANLDTAASLSALDDQLAIDLESAGYDDQSAVIIATVGDAVAVDGDVLVSPHWEEVLGVRKMRHPQLWNEAELEAPTPRVGRPSWKLEDHLTDFGYEHVKKFGGAVPVGEEIELDTDSLIERVAEEQKIPEALVRLVAESKKGQFVYQKANQGEVTVYAMPKKRPRKR